MARMVAAWPMVALGEVVRQRKEFVQIDDLAEYRRCRVQLHAQGIVLRDIVAGAEVKTKSQQVCQAGEFLVAEIDAKVGGFGVVPDDLEGAIVSSHYFLFVIDGTRLDRRFLDYYIRTHDFMGQVQAQGSTNYAAIRPTDVLRYKMPLPALDEQRSIVARIEELAAPIEDAKGLRREAMAEAQQLLASACDAQFRRLRSAGFPMTTVAEHEELVTSGPRNFGSRYVQSGMRFYRAQDLTSKGEIADDGAVYVEMPPGMTTRAMVMSGDILIVITGATIGRTAVVCDHHPEGLVSQHVGLVRVNHNLIDSRYLHYCILAPSFAGGQLDEAKYGQGKPGLNLANLRSLRFPLTPVAEQQKVVSYLDEVRAQQDQLVRLQRETSYHLDALLPSVLDKAFRGEL